MSKKPTNTGGGGNSGGSASGSKPIGTFNGDKADVTRSHGNQPPPPPPKRK